MILEQKLKESILDRQVTHNRDVTIIITNPETFNELAYEIGGHVDGRTYEEFIDYLNSSPAEHNWTSFYMGIPIIRSEDIPKGQFLIK